jgi:hypothetical protein
MSLRAAVFLDLATVSGCVAVLIARGGLRHSHPAVLYVVFHVMVVTMRVLAINQGSPTFLSETPGLDGPTPEEIARAVNYADLALVAATVGWTHGGRLLRARKAPVEPAAAAPHSSIEASSKWSPVSGKIIGVGALIFMPIGIYALTEYAFIPGGEVPVYDNEISILVTALLWPGLLLLAFIYRYGFRFYLTIPLALYLAIISLQGTNRFRLILPVILLCLIHLDRRGRRWPGLGMLAALTAVVLFFFPMKVIGAQVKAGGGIAEIVSAVRDSAPDSMRGRANDQAILDQLALTLSLTDRHGKVFWGRPYANTVFLPLPRSFWSAKPGLADHLKEMSTDTRPMGQIGGVTTLIGDLYLNFRLPGLVLIAYGLARLSRRSHIKAYRSSYWSLRRFVYLLLASISIQVFRDGLVSLPVFMLVAYLPLVVIVLLHWRGLERERPLQNRAIPQRATDGSSGRPVNAALSRR